MLATFTEIVQRTRQHHAIEHATIHMLSARMPHGRFSGHSDPQGFTLYADVEEETVRRAVGDALLRLQAGEHHLAIHPNCGTNLATAGLLVTLASLLTSAGRRPAAERFATTLILVLPLLVLARPLGFRLQRYTTSPHVANRWLAAIQPLSMGRVRAYRVLFD